MSAAQTAAEATQLLQQVLTGADAPEAAKGDRIAPKHRRTVHAPEGMLTMRHEAPPMTTSAARAVQVLLDYYQDQKTTDRRAVRPDEAHDAWIELAEDAREALGTGMAPHEVAAKWRPFHEANPLLEYDPHDAEQCPACDHVNDLCPYHRGLEDGRAMFAEVIAYLNHDPDQLNAVLADAQRNEEYSK